MYFSFTVPCTDTTNEPEILFPLLSTGYAFKKITAIL
jgi:hypothetical protein